MSLKGLCGGIFVELEERFLFELKIFLDIL